MNEGAERPRHGEQRRAPSLGLLMLSLSAWIRGQHWLQAIYRHRPQGLRNRASSLLAARASGRARFPRTPRWALQPSAHPGTLRAERSAGSGTGVNILGYIRGQFGLAESARLYARALIEAGADVALYDIDLDLPHGWDDHSLDGWIGTETPHPVSILFVNPDCLQPALAQIGAARLQGRYLIACWFWELEAIPEEWIEALEHVDEVMVASQFVEDAFRRVTDKPVLRVPLPLSTLPDSGLERADFGLEEEKFTFLVTFDFNSWIARKNPYAVLNAFREAFPAGRDDVRLLIKSSNGFRHPDRFRTLLKEVEADARVVVRDEVIDRAHVNALQRCCDVYVSLHRSEGFGLGLAECMAMGKPVIATNWSGNLDFMDADCAALVGYRMVAVQPGEYPHGEGQYWAEADIAEAALWMRKLADDPQAARELGQRGRENVTQVLSRERAAEHILARLGQIELDRSRHAGKNDLEESARRGTP